MLINAKVKIVNWFLVDQVPHNAISMANKIADTKAQGFTGVRFQVNSRILDDMAISDRVRLEGLIKQIYESGLELYFVFTYNRQKVVGSGNQVGMLASGAQDSNIYIRTDLVPNVAYTLCSPGVTPNQATVLANWRVVVQIASTAPTFITQSLYSLGYKFGAGLMGSTTLTGGSAAHPGVFNYSDLVQPLVELQNEIDSTALIVSPASFGRIASDYDVNTTTYDGWTMRGIRDGMRTVKPSVKIGSSSSWVRPLGWHNAIKNNSGLEFDFVAYHVYYDQFSAMKGSFYLIDNVFTYISNGIPGKEIFVSETNYYEENVMNLGDNTFRKQYVMPVAEQAQFETDILTQANGNSLVTHIGWFQSIDEEIKSPPPENTLGTSRRVGSTLVLNKSGAEFVHRQTLISDATQYVTYIKSVAGNLTERGGNLRTMSRRAPTAFSGYQMITSLPVNYRNRVDCTASINAALSDPANSVVVLPKKSTLYIAGTINIPSNKRLVFLRGSELKQTANNAAPYNMISVINATNYRIDNPVLIGDKYTKNNWTINNEGHGIYVAGASTGQINYLRASYTSLDGICIDGTSSLQWCDGLTVEDPQIKYPGRNGVTLISGKNITVNAGYAGNGWGVKPMAGISVKPTTNNHELQNIVFNNFTTENCPGFGTSVDLTTLRGVAAKTVTVSFNKCLDKGSSYNNQVICSTVASTGTISGSINYTECLMENYEIRPFTATGNDALVLNVTKAKGKDFDGNSLSDAQLLTQFNATKGIVWTNKNIVQ